MAVTNIDNQEVELKKKIKKFYLKARPKLLEGYCPTKDLMAATLDKWSLFVIYYLGYNQTMRFGELKREINGISGRMLSVTLKKLEKNKIVNRRVFAEVPPKVEYNLTDLGKELTERLVKLNDWILDNFENPSKIE